MKPLLCFAASIAALAFAIPSRAAINDIYPGDYIPAAAGQSAFVVYAYDRHLDGPYSSGSNLSTKSRDSQSLFILAAKYFDLQGIRMAASGSVGVTNQATATFSSLARDEVTGVSDPKFSITIWPYLNHQSNHSIAINLAQLVKLGSYDNNQAQNIGQNRYRTALSLAWAKQTSTKTFAEITAEIDRFGVNPNFGSAGARLEQNPAGALTAFLRYQVTDRISPYVGYQWNWGGTSFVNGVSQADSLRAERAYLGLRFIANSSHLVQLRVAKDTSVDSGFGLARELVLRWTWLPN